MPNTYQTGPHYPFIGAFILTLLLLGCKGRPETSTLNLLTIDISAITIEHSEEARAAGRRVYIRHCMQCHLPGGGGSVGADLTDDAWVIGGSDEDILRVIAAGTNRGMPGWGALLSHEEIAQVVAWIYEMNPHLQARRDGAP